MASSFEQTIHDSVSVFAEEASAAVVVSIMVAPVEVDIVAAAIVLLVEMEAAPAVSPPPVVLPAPVVPSFVLVAVQSDEGA